MIAIIIIVVVVLFIIVTIAGLYKTCLWPLFAGAWMGTDKFLADSDLSLFHLYITPRRMSTTLEGTLIMKKLDGTVISGQKLTVGNLPLYIPGPFEKEVEIKYEENEVMPTKMTMKGDLRAGTMTLSAGGKIYAELKRS
jgi:hypothetical protein